MGSLGLPKFVASENSKVWGSGSAIAAFTYKDRTPRILFQVGYDLEKLWLLMVSKGYSCQILAGIPALAAGIHSGKLDHFSHGQQEKVLQTYTDMKVIAETSQEIAAFLRIGIPVREVIGSHHLDPKVQYI